MSSRRIDSATGPRFYETPDGARFPSVTSILKAINKPALIDWAASRERALVVQAAADLHEDLPIGTRKMSRAAYVTTLETRLPRTKAHRSELDAAGDIGSKTHALIEWNLRKELGQVVGAQPVLKDEALFAFSAYQEWRQSVHLCPIAIEQVVWSSEWGYAGTQDLLAEVNGEPTVLDWKTGKAIYPEARLQVAAYAHALVEMGHATWPLRALIVRLPKTVTDPGFEVLSLDADELVEAFRVFLNVLEVWKWMQPAEQPEQGLGAPVHLRTSAEPSRLEFVF